MITSNETIRNSKSRYLRLSSEDRIFGTNTRFTIDTASAGGIIDNVKGFITHSIECPNVFNNVASYNNVLVLRSGAGATTFNVAMPTGYYLINDFIAELETVINTAIALNPFPATVSITSVGIFPNNKLNFLFAGDDFTMVLEGSTLAKQVGLTADVTAFDGILTPVQAIPNLIGETAVYVHSKSLAPNNLMEGTGSFSVVDKLNLEEQFGFTCYSDFNNDSTHFKKYFPFESLKSIRTVQITLRNRVGNVLEMPDNFDFTMMMILYYR